MTISIANLEEVAALGWRAPEERRLGGWLLRAANGFTGRANSALATGDPGQPLADATEFVREWYRSRNLAAGPASPPRAAAVAARRDAVADLRTLAGFRISPG